MKTARTIAFVLALTVTATQAHEGVKDPDVKARMQAMEVIGKNAKTLGQMARGQIIFDASAAEAAIAAMQDQTARIPELFEPRADDPKSEALPTVWSDRDGFLDSNDALGMALANADLSSAHTIAQSMRSIGKACGACHNDYRE